MTLNMRFDTHWDKQLFLANIEYPKYDDIVNVTKAAWDACKKASISAENAELNAFQIGGDPSQLGYILMRKSDD